MRFGKYALLPALFMTILTGHAQNIENVNYKVVDNKMHLTYDLIYDLDDAAFSISVYFGDQKSQTIQLTNATGEIGDKSIFPGKDKIIIIDDLAQFDSFSSDLKFKIVYTIVYIPVHDFFVTGKKFKRGNIVPISWKGGKSGEIVQLTLMKGEDELYSMDQTIFAFFIEGSREMSFLINKNVKRGDDYKIQLTTADSTSFISSDFSIRPKIPLVVKIGSIVVVGGLVAILAGVADSGGGDSPAQESLVPDLPDGAHPGGG